MGHQFAGDRESAFIVAQRAAALAIEADLITCVASQSVYTTFRSSLRRYMGPRGPDESLALWRDLSTSMKNPTQFLVHYTSGRPLVSLFLSGLPVSLPVSPCYLFLEKSM